jgi:multiple sugar transport system permease protein
MAVVSSPGKRIRNRLAIVAVFVATLIFLAPIYWIGSTAFKPREVATSVPPTVLFQPETTAFVKLFTRRVQLREPPTEEEYAAAPWWEQRIYDGGERVLRVRGEVQLSAYPDRFLNSLIVAITSTVLAVGMGTLTAYGFSRFKVSWRFSPSLFPEMRSVFPLGTADECSSAWSGRKSAEVGHA